MTNRTRRFLFVATGILVVGLGTGLVASYMGGLQGLTLIGGNGPAELEYVPPTPGWWPSPTSATSWIPSSARS